MRWAISTPETSPPSRPAREILGFVVEGLSNAEIGRRLYLSESTIKQHLRAAYKLLGVSNRTEAANLFRRGNWALTNSEPLLSLCFNCTGSEGMRETEIGGMMCLHYGTI
jgi:hypothetical protein